MSTDNRTLIENMLDRALLEKLDDSGETQSSKIEGGFSGTLEEVERIQNYGFTSFPGPSAQVFYVCLGGSQELPIVLTADHPELRKKIQEWESAMWTKFGNSVYLKADGSIELSSKEEGTVVTMKPDGKLSIKNKQGELIAVLSEVIQALIDAKVATAIGPQPLSTVALLTQAKSKIDSFKG